jgi:DNA-binding transcriptional LysR family regulator
MWQTIDLRELRVFLTLAEELHFGRTAEQLGLTPSRVSQSVRELEHKLGGQLVHRTSRRVELTAFGDRFQRKLIPAMHELNEVLERANTAARSLEGTLRLGMLSGPAGGPHLINIISAFEARHPECKVEVVQMSWDDPFARLRENDIELMASWIPLGEPDLVIGPILTRQPRILAVAPDHPLASNQTVTIEQIADHRVARFPGWPKALDDAVIPSTTPSGRPIPEARIRVGEQNILDLPVRVARREIVHPAVESAIPYMGGRDLVFIPITGMPPLRSALVWHRGTRNPKLREFIITAREILRRSGTPPGTRTAHPTP